MGQGHQNQISSCPCPNNIAVCVWSKSIHSFKSQDADKPFSNNLSPPMTLKMGSRSPKSHQSYPCSNNISVQVWSKSINSFRRYGADMPFPNILKPCVTLKIRSMSPKSIQFLSMSKQYSYMQAWSKSIHTFRR